MILLAAGVAISGCGRGNRAPAPAGAEVSLRGRVAILGATPLEQVVVVPEDSAAVSLEIVGGYRGELARLNGAWVSVVGELAGAGRLSVSEYRVLEIAGHVPVVGRLTVAEGKASVTTAEGAAVSLEGAPPELLAHSGAKVWVIFDEAGAVTGYGILREP